MNYYDVVGCSDNATQQEIHDACRRAVLRAHPDKGGTSEHFQLVENARNTLLDTPTRVAYDISLRLPSLPPESAMRLAHLIRCRQFVVAGCNQYHCVNNPGELQNTLPPPPVAP